METTFYIRKRSLLMAEISREFISIHIKLFLGKRLNCYYLDNNFIYKVFSNLLHNQFVKFMAIVRKWFYGDTVNIFGQEDHNLQWSRSY